MRKLFSLLIILALLVSGCGSGGKEINALANQLSNDPTISKNIEEDFIAYKKDGKFIFQAKANNAFGETSAKAQYEIIFKGIELIREAKMDDVLGSILLHYQGETYEISNSDDTIMIITSGTGDSSKYDSKEVIIAEEPEERYSIDEFYSELVPDDNNSQQANTNTYRQNSNSNTYSSTFSLTKDEKSDAYIYAQYIIKQNLKAPSTAEFPWFQESFVSGVGNEIIITAYVDAENSFGAKLRQPFVVILDKSTKEVKDFSIGY